MRQELSAVLLCLAASGCFATASAQSIYRCGNSYSQQPCPNGTPVQADDARSAAQRAEASAAAQRDAKAADAMEKARLKEEAKPAQAYIPPPKTQDDVKPAAAKPGKPDVFKATSPAKPGDAKTKKKRAKKKAA